ncbi:hypothetical protein ACP4OV_015056 [Aristida adscensionis]
MSTSSPCRCGGAPMATEEEGVLAAPAPLLDLEKGRLPAPAPEAVRDPVKVMANWAGRRIAKFIYRGLFILLGMYIFNSMKRYAVDYMGGDTWFTTFAVTAVAVPIAEILCILGQSLNHCMPPQESFFEEKPPQH